MTKLFLILCLFCSFAMAEDVVFRLSHPMTLTDGQPIAATDLSFRVECGNADNGTFLDWVEAIGVYSPDTNGVDSRTLTPPVKQDYWCRAIAIDTVNTQESAPSNVVKIDFIDPPNPATLEIEIIVTSPGGT